jgi:hypothetical protein
MRSETVMTKRSRLVLATVAALGLSMAVAGCGGGDGGGNGGVRGGGTVTGEIYAASGGTFVAIGGQTLSIGNRTATSQPGTGRFTISGVPAGAFTVVVTPSGFGSVLNPDILEGVAVADQTVDIGRILLGQRPPEPPEQ